MHRFWRTSLPTKAVRSWTETRLARCLAALFSLQVLTGQVCRSAIAGGCLQPLQCAALRSRRVKKSAERQAEVVPTAFRSRLLGYEEIAVSDIDRLG